MADNKKNTEPTNPGLRGQAQPVDPQMTLRVKNPRIPELIEAFKQSRASADLNALLGACMETRILTPVIPQKIGDKTIPLPAVFSVSDQPDTKVVWAFSDQEQLQKKHPAIAGVINISFADLVRLISESKNAMTGIALNPLTDGITFTKNTLQALRGGEDVGALLEERRIEESLKGLPELGNEAFEKAMADYKEKTDSEHLKQMVEAAGKALVLTQFSTAERDGKKVQVHMFMKTADEKHLLLPVYTDKKALPSSQKNPCMVLPFPEIVKNAVRISENDPGFFGVIVNPGAENMRFGPALLKAMLAHPDDPEAVMDQLVSKEKPVQMTEQQYLAFEHLRFENAALPAALFAEGREFIDALCSRREEYIDQLFEESYQNKRMYPYLPEDFSVMPLRIKEHLEVIRVDFPEQDQAAGALRRAYITWNEQTATGRYFGLVLGKNKSESMMELRPDGQRTELGVFRSEGEELSKVTELAE